MKYLTIKNWDKYQPDQKLKDKFASLKWVKDYTDKEFDSDYMDLTFFQRYVLDALCRLRGRLGHDIPYDDPTWVARLLHAVRTDAPHIPHAVATLLARGFLALQNDEVTCREGEGEGETGEVRGETGENLRSAQVPTKPTPRGVRLESRSKAAGED